MAAALVEMAARFSDAQDTAGRAETRRGECLRLAKQDADAYAAVLATRGQARAEALSRAAEVPLRVAETAAEIAELGAALVERGNPNLRGDAVTAVLLAEAAARAAANLVEINLQAGEDDRVERGRALARIAAAASERCLAAGR